MNTTTEESPLIQARIAGLLYLIVIIGGIFAELYVRGQLVVSGDAAATARNILQHETLYRAGFATELFYLACNVPLTLIFYNLFKIVSKRLSLMVVFYSLVGTAIEGASLLAHYVPLALLRPSRTLSGFTTEQLQSAAYTSLRIFESGFAIALVFFGCFCLTLAVLIFRSTFFPKFIGALLVIEGLCYLLTSFARFLAPALAARLFPFLLASAIAEISLCLWLLVMGVNRERWTAQASAAALHGVAV